MSCKKYQSVITWKILVLSCIIIFSTIILTFVYINALNIENDEIETAFNTNSQQIISSIKKAIDYHIIFLELSSAIFTTISENITRLQFTNFTQSIIHLQSSIRAIQWAKRIKNSERKYYEDLARKETGIQHGFLDRTDNNTFFPSPMRDIYYPIYYVTPLEENTEVYLYDPSANAQRFRFSQKSIDTRKPVLSTPIFLLQDTAENLEPSYLMLNAVFDNGINFGINIIIFHLNSLLNNFLSNNNIQYMIVSIIDNNDIITSVWNNNGTWIPYIGNINGKYSVSHTIPIIDRNWTIKTTALEGYFDTRKTDNPLTVLIVSLIIILIEIIGVSYTVFQTINITQKKEQEKLISKENNLKFTFINYLSHEIRVPFNTVYGVIQTLLSTENMNEENMNLLKMAKSASKQAIEILSHVLDMEKIDKQLFELNMSWFTLEELAKVVYWTYQQLAIESGLKMNLNIDKSIHNFEFYGDIIRLRQCLSNYISNSLKFTQKGSVKIFVYEISARDDYKKIRCEVVDTGCGISEEDQKELFLPYKQLKQECSAKGTGLGLTIVKSIANLHGGDVGTSSCLGVGSKFYFDFEAKYRKITDIEMKQHNTIINMTPDQKTKLLNTNLTVIIIEDDIASRNMLKHILERKKIQCDIAENGRIGVEMILKTPNKYDVIFMDKTMPEMSGIEATIELRKLGINIPIIALTGNVLASEKQKFIDAGATDWLMKPVQLRKLYSAISNVMGNR